VLVPVGDGRGGPPFEQVGAGHALGAVSTARNVVKGSGLQPPCRFDSWPRNAN
jgi:hypothetical protein